MKIQIGPGVAHKADLFFGESGSEDEAFILSRLPSAVDRTSPDKMYEGDDARKIIKVVADICFGECDLLIPLDEEASRLVRDTQENWHP